MTQPHYWNTATRQLRRTCPLMHSLIPRYKGEGLRARGDGFYTLLRAVVGQQISVKAADAVWARLAQAVSPLTPHMLLAQPEETLRACGLSASKVVYARNVGAFYVQYGLMPSNEADFWARQSDAEAIALLTAIKGIGVWTAEMFLIFHLMRPDVFPVKDLGVLKAINLHLLSPAALEGKKWLLPKEYNAIAQRWAPYRTVATWYLWRALDPVPVEY